MTELSDGAVIGQHCAGHVFRPTSMPQQGIRPEHKALALGVEKGQILGAGANRERRGAVSVERRSELLKPILRCLN